MINEFTKSDYSEILHVVNDAAERYRNVIPDNCWKEPYMPESELLDVFGEGVKMFGYVQDNKLISVMGFQETMDVVLIRHAYTLTEHQGKGTGSTLLKYLLGRNKDSRLLVGTWRDAEWAIKFYEKFGFVLHEKKESTLLLEKYWNIPQKQIEHSAVLEKIRV
uniref:Acetyltransferase (GNAT) family protein n=1 Tax=uncultured marine thaumarchaeote AD1000_11_E10 TaxID=1455890 RepID=A0A075FPK3_9ARCH|nr:acetyltransferase (GNAT) family protein [uncultured marine thaumarchaeote AD1000_11_E10]